MTRTSKILLSLLLLVQPTLTRWVYLKKIPPTAGTLDVDEMDPSENKIPATAGTLLDIDKMDPSEIKIPATAGTLLDIDEMGKWIIKVIVKSFLPFLYPDTLNLTQTFRSTLTIQFL